MNTKYLLSAGLFSLLSCQPEVAPLSTDDNCPAEDPAMIVASLPTPAPVLDEVKIELAPEPPKEEKKPTRDESELRAVSSFGEKQFLLLQPSEQSIAKKGSKAEWVSKKKGLFAVRRDVELSLVPESTAAWMGQGVTLLQKDGTFCDAKVSGLALLGQIYVFNDETKWKGASSLFTLAQNRGGVQVVAELAPNNCKDVRFARLASLPKPTMFTPEVAPKELRSLVLTQARTLPAYKQIQARYSEYKQNYGDLKWGRWENYYDGRPNVSTIKTPTQTLVYASIQQEGGCGDFYGGLFALWRVNTDNTLTLLFQGDSDTAPDAALDINEDGTLEFLQGSDWRELRNGKYESGYYFDIPMEEDVCGC